MFDLALLFEQKACLFLKLLVGLLELFLLLLEQFFGGLERLRLQFKTPVRLLKLGLPELQLLGQRLRLLKQLLGPHVGLDRVDNDADRFGQLV